MLNNSFRINQILLFLLLFLIGNVFGQQASDDRIKLKYLEHLVKIKADSVRNTQGLNLLANDSILYLASQHHAKYLLDKAILRHEEVEYRETRSPQERAEYYGAINYGVSENILFTSITGVKSLEEMNFTEEWYQSKASEMVRLWVESPGHYKNMISSSPQVTGVAISIDWERNRIYGVQKFARVYYRYVFEESKDLFPYSTYSAEKVNSFDGIENKLTPGYEYDFGLSHDKQEQCLDCHLWRRRMGHYTLRIDDKKNFILRVDSARVLSQMMDRKWDGFTVEIVSFDDYMCENPEYYTKSSRRNGQSKLNGKVLPPVYKNYLARGYRKRKRNEKVRFVPYILGSDSVSFVRRFGKYKQEKYSAEYFELKIGKVPKDLSGYWAYNLVYLQNKEICHTSYFTGHCGDLYSEFLDTEFIPRNDSAEYTLKPKPKEVNFKIDFEQGKHEFSNEEIKPFLTSLDNLEHSVDSIKIKAYSSVEGDIKVNNQLQEKRAKGIVRAILNKSEIDVPLKINTISDYKGFRVRVKKIDSLSYVADLSKAEIRAKIREIGAKKLEPLLAPSRKAFIQLFCRIEVTENNLKYLIQEEFKKLNKRIYETRIPQERGMYSREISDLYAYVYKLIKEERLSPLVLTEIHLPLRQKESLWITEQFVHYGMEYWGVLKDKPSWRQEFNRTFDWIAELESPQFTASFDYLLVRENILDMLKQGNINKEKIQNCFDAISGLKRHYQDDEKIRANIEKLNFNLNMILLNEVFVSDPEQNSADAIKSIVQVHEYYLENKLMDKIKAVALGKMSVFYKNVEHAYKIMDQYSHTDEVTAYMTQLEYRPPVYKAYEWYFDELIKLQKTMAPEIWCNMFLGSCAIPFQAFEHEELRALFCEECLSKNQVLNNMISPSTKN